MNALVILLLTALQARDASHRAVYEKAADSIVGIRATAPLGERSGSGVIISKDGLILTSYSTCPEGSDFIRVYLRGPKLLMAKLVGTSPGHELSILKVDPKADLVPIEFGDSSKVKEGDVSYTLGNASNSIINNDSASLGVGIISGIYTLRDPRGLSIYVGPVFETTAAVNVGMEGSPLLDPKGRMVGFVTLNYSPSRFLGNAIPSASIRDAVDKILKESPVSGPATPAEARPGYLGITVADRNGKIVIETVDPGSPADKGGLARGIVVVALGGRSLKDAAEFRSLQKELKEGDLLFLKVNDGGSVTELKIYLGRKDEK
ncbi:MAG TPA: trypsin-like peptidase domain-containing protein [Planctomycetota bacterium]|nr:trypsin-like peptidase domain-containing protein [Planctomycetota bacterium]